MTSHKLPGILASSSAITEKYIMVVLPEPTHIGSKKIEGKVQQVVFKRMCGPKVSLLGGIFLKVPSDLLPLHLF